MAAATQTLDTRRTSRSRYGVVHNSDNEPPAAWGLRTADGEDSDVNNQNALHHAQHAWRHFLSSHPLLYLPDHKPHGDCNALNTSGTRPLWSHEELLKFQRTVEQRTQTLQSQQQAVLQHWRLAATRIQAAVKGHLARRRVLRMRAQLREHALAAARARALLALRKQQLHAAIRIQRVYHARCVRLHFVFVCRERLQRSLRLYTFRWSRTRAARTVQRCFRQYRRRVRLWAALRSVIRLLRLSRQREELDAAVMAFQHARVDAIEQKRRLQWELYPMGMTQATRVQQRKTLLANKTTVSKYDDGGHGDWGRGAASVALVLPMVKTAAPVSNQSPTRTGMSISTTNLPRLATYTT